MSNRKYPTVEGYWLYTIYVPSVAKYYVGVSKQPCNRRWRKTNYKGMALEPYLSEWQDMTKTIIVDNLTKEEAYQYEDNIIRALQMNDLCINERRSGLIEVSDKNAYQKELLKNNIEYRERQKQLRKQWYENNKEEVLERKKQYYEDNKESIKEKRRQRYQNDVELREKKKQRDKRYREDNKEKIKEYQKQYYLKKKLEKQQQTSLL